MGNTSGMGRRKNDRIALVLIAINIGTLIANCYLLSETSKQIVRNNTHLRQFNRIMGSLAESLSSKDRYRDL